MKKMDALTVLAVVMVLTSCKGSDPLIGRWQKVDEKDWSEYFADGSAIFNDGSMSVSGTWKRLDDGRLKIDATVFGISTAEVFQVAIERDTATFTSSGGQVESYRRVSNVAAQESSVSDQQAQKRTIADIRNTGTAMFSWLTDQVGSGAAGQAEVDFAKYPAISAKELEKILVPQYLQAIPETDGWGHPYEYYLNVASPRAKQVMSIRSSGRDGSFSSVSYSVEAFAPSEYDEDIAWADGYFVRWPQKPKE